MKIMSKLTNNILNGIKILKINDDKTDVQIIIGDKYVSAHKSFLSSKSQYLAQIMNKQDFKGVLRINENCFEYFDTVLKLTYGLTDNRISNDWNSVSPNKFFSLIQTTNQYKFIETEKMICEKFVKTFPPIHKFPKNGLKSSEESIECENSLSTVWEIYEKSKSLQLKRLSDVCLNFIDQNASQVYKYFDWLLYTPIDVLIDVFKRDSFGLPEIQIFNMIKKWCGFWNNDKIDLKLILSTIRLQIIDKKDLKETVLLSGLFESQTIEKMMNDLDLIDFIPDMNNRFRIRFEPNRRFKANNYSIDYCSVPLNTFIIPKTESVLVDVRFEMKTRINHIEFKMISTLFDLVYYYVEVFDSNHNEWVRVINNSETPCNASQSLYFNEQLTKHFRIIATNCEDNQLIINDISYGFDDNYSDFLIDNNEHNQNLIPVIDALYIVCFDSFDMNYYPIDDFSCIDTNVVDNQLYIEEETEYYIRLSQPIVMQSLEIWLILETKSSMNEKFKAKFKVEVCSSFGLTFISSNWIKAGEKMIDKTGCYRMAFNKQKVILIRISGFRYCLQNNQKLPLKVFSVEVPKTG